MMTSRWVVRTYRFSDDKRWLILSSTTLFVCLFLSCSNWKKNVSLLPEKNNNFFLYLFNPFFLFCFCQKKTFFICFFFFFCFHSDDNWWQVGRWYGIPNLVMTWWLGWVVVTKWSKCWWRHTEMVPNIDVFPYVKWINWNLLFSFAKSCFLFFFNRKNIFLSEFLTMIFLHLRLFKFKTGIYRVYFESMSSCIGGKYFYPKIVKNFF